MKKYYCIMLLPVVLLLQAQTTPAAATGKPMPVMPAAVNANVQGYEVTPCDAQLQSEPTPFDKSRFSHMAAFSGNGSFSVPAGVTEVLIEMWGAGGGGHIPGGGGGSGGYWTGLIPVTGITSISITIGQPGLQATGATAAGNGGNTGFSCTGFNVSTGGGGGADTVSAANLDSYIGGQGGVAMVNSVMPADFNAFYSMNGQNGTPTMIDFVQVNATSFAKRTMAGMGGIAPFSGQAPNVVSGTVSIAVAGLKPISSTYISSPISAFGSGGNIAGLNVPMPGGKGRLAIYF